MMTAAGARRGVAVALAGLLAACGGKGPNDPGPGVVNPISLICGPDVRIENVVGPTSIVAYASPAPAGGVPPIAISCSVASGAAFALGTTPVVCTGTDGVRVGQCGFKVTVVPAIPVLRLTKFLAFGDSITAGENGEDPTPQIIDEQNSYEKKLEYLLAQRYTSQIPVVTPDGIGREKAIEGKNRIDRDLDANRPEALLLLEGVNDLSGDLQRDRDSIITGLRYDIQAAKARGIVVFVSTLLPEDEKPGNRAHNSDEINPVNSAIRMLAAEQNVTLVDTWMAYAGHGFAGDFLDADGLHPTAAGNQATAEAFFAAIQTTLEVPLAGAPASSSRIRPASPGGLRRPIK